MKNILANKKTNFRAIALSVVFGFCALFVPFMTIFGDRSAYAYTTPRDVYQTTNKITVPNSTFESTDSSTSFSPSNWTASAEYSDAHDERATSWGGVIDTNPLTWEETFESWVNVWANSWKTLNPSLENKDTIASNLSTHLNSNKFLSPSIPNYDPNSTTEKKVLMVRAGDVFNETYADLTQTTPREAYYKFVSKEFTLGAYSYYKISVYVQTSNGANASIKLVGDIENDDYSTISNYDATHTHNYIYKWTNCSDTKDFVSLTQAGTNNNDTITYESLVYKYDTTQSKYLIDTTQEGYNAETMAEYKISYVADQDTTQSSWKKYELFIETAESATVSLELALGNQDTKSSGMAFFDDVVVEQIQLRDYYTAIEGNQIKKSSARTTLNVLEDFDNSTLAETSWSLVPNDDPSSASVSIENEIDETGIEQTFVDGDVNNDNNILKIDNPNTKAVALKSSDFDIEQFRYYRLSIWARSDNAEDYYSKNASLTFNLYGETNSGGIPHTGKFSSVSATYKPYVQMTNQDSTSVSSVNNYWQEYTFNICGCPLYDTIGYLTVSLTTMGKVYLDNFAIEEITQATYAASSATKLDLTKSIPTEKIQNGHFNAYNSVEVGNFTDSLLPVADWTGVGTTKQTKYEYYANSSSTNYIVLDEADLTLEETYITYNGNDFNKDANDANLFVYDNSKIVKKVDVEYTWNDAKKAYYNSTYNDTVEAPNLNAGIIPGRLYDSYKSLVGNENEPTTPIDFENYLAIYSSTNTSFGYKSSAIALTANNVYRISVLVYTNNSSSGSILLSNDKNTLAEIQNVNTGSTWKEYVIYINTGSNTTSVYLTLNLGGKSDAQGVIFFRSATYSTITSTSFSNQLKSNSNSLHSDGVSLVDLSNETFAEISTDLNSNNLYDAMLYSQNDIPSTTSGIVGILDTENSHSDYQTITAKDSEVSPYVLVMKNNAGEHTKITSKKNLVLSASSYYKVSIFAKTNNMEADKSATISFPNISTDISINTDNYTNSDTNNYKEFLLYVATGTSALNLNPTISMLNMSGTLIVDSITLTSIDEDAFSSIKSQDELENTSVVDLTGKTDDTEPAQSAKPSDPADELDDNKLEIFFVVLSSIILVGAILIALIFKGTKHLPKPKHNKVDKKFETGDDDSRGFI